MQLFDIPRRVEEEKNEELIPRWLAVETASTVRALVEPMMRAHFFAMEMDALFSRYRLLLEAYYRAEATHNKDDVTKVFLVLEKKQSSKCRYYKNINYCICRSIRPSSLLRDDPCQQDTIYACNSLVCTPTIFLYDHDIYRESFAVVHGMSISNYYK
jgi:hypothetical protein